VFTALWWWCWAIYDMFVCNQRERERERERERKRTLIVGWRVVLTGGGRRDVVLTGGRWCRS
jgi:hypothetical protein